MEAITIWLSGFTDEIVTIDNKGQRNKMLRSRFEECARALGLEVSSAIALAFENAERTGVLDLADASLGSKVC